MSPYELPITSLPKDGISPSKRKQKDKWNEKDSHAGNQCILRILSIYKASPGVGCDHCKATFKFPWQGSLSLMSKRQGQLSANCTLPKRPRFSFFTVVLHCWSFHVIPQWLPHLFVHRAMRTPAIVEWRTFNAITFFFGYKWVRRCPVLFFPPEQKSERKSAKLRCGFPTLLSFC